MNNKLEECAALVQVMKEGGYYQRIMQSGSELDRVKAWLRILGGEQAPQQAPLQYPDYPCFPGLRNAPFRPAADLPGALLLEQHAPAIRADMLALQDQDYLFYHPPKMRNLWALHLLYYMGVSLEPVAPRCPATHALLRALPGICLDYPWGDALFSVHTADSHLAAHCSVDNLRVRCHLGLQVPPGCAIRVGEETRGWEDGRALLFEDSFEHEVWNRGAARRAILIVDFWHPDLTPIEIEALTAGFRKSEVRRRIMFKRLDMIRRGPEAYASYLWERIEQDDAQPLVQHYWRR